LSKGIPTFEKQKPGDFNSKLHSQPLSYPFETDRDFSPGSYPFVHAKSIYERVRFRYSQERDHQFDAIQGSLL
jgi:hypothetical protein